MSQGSFADCDLDLSHRQHAEDGDGQDPAEDGGRSHAETGEAEGEVVESFLVKLGDLWTVSEEISYSILYIARVEDRSSTAGRGWLLKKRLYIGSSTVQLILSNLARAVIPPQSPASSCLRIPACT